ncbi:MAG TPA: response regulator [Candidatus Saccharimonadales bacterium]|nr:response regulator [Candidatus Saccharimonadales bacterium]
MWEGRIHNQLPLNIQSITHPLAQGQLNNNRTKSIIRVSLKNNARSSVENANDFMTKRKQTMRQKVVLVDDDNKSLLRSWRHLLSSETYEVVLAENVQHAIAKSEAGEIDLLLMNLHSPTEQGWEAIAEITKENPFLPVVVVTRQSELRKLAEAAGVRALVEEPVDGPILLQTIRELLAEPIQSRMRRTCTQEIEFRHVPPGSGDFRELLHRRYTAPFYFPLPTSRWGINE